MMNRLLSLSQVFSGYFFDLLLPPTPWTTRDHVLIAGLFTFGGIVALLCCILYLLPHGHDYRIALASGCGAVISALVALNSWNQWLVRRHAD